MAKINQIIAIEKGLKNEVYGVLTSLNKIVQKPDLMNGFTKKYRPDSEDGQTFPPENKKVQVSARNVISEAAESVSKLINLTARKDYSNCNAKADVVVDGKTLIAECPVTYMLFLEKQLVDFRTFVTNIPILDNGEDWSYDASSGVFKTQPTTTHKTKKMSKPIVLYDATADHPAQTQLINEDVLVGYWDTVKMSGAVASTRRGAIISRINKLLAAVKSAREEANSVQEVKTPDIGTAIFGYLLSE